MVGFRRTKAGVRAALNALTALNKRKRQQGKITKHYKAIKRVKVPDNVKTATRKHLKRTHYSHGDNGTSVMYEKVYINKDRVKDQASGKWIYSQFVPEVPNSNAGVQATQSFALATISQLATSTGVGHSGLENQVGLRHMNPNLYNTGSAYLSSGQLPTTDAFVISTMKLEMEITSWMDLAQTVELHCYVAKSGSQDDVATVWSRGYQQQGSGKSFSTKLVSPLFQGVAGYGQINEPYSRPTDVSEYMKEVYTYKGTRSFNLQSGSTQKMTYDFVVNKKVRSAVLDQAAADGEITYGGLTAFVVMTVRGQIVCDTTSAINKPTFATTRVGVVTRQSYVCHTVNSPIANRTVGIHAFNLPINASLANQALIDVNDDVDIAKPVV